MSDGGQWFRDEKFGAFWERTYRARGLSSMGGPSHEVIEVAAALPRGARVLDLGCGEGRNALYLASRGCDVLAVDRSEAGLGKLAAIAREAGIPLRTEVADVRAFRFSEPYRLVMAHGLLYYLHPEEWRALVAAARDWTLPGGFNIYTVFIFDAEYPCPEQFASAGYLGSLRSGELRTAYTGWEILRWDEYVKWDEHPGVGEHYHPIEKLVARKPPHDQPAPERIAREFLPQLSAEQFDGVKCGTPAGEVEQRFGAPPVCDRYFAPGLQFGAGAETVHGYTLELWHYGCHVFYLTNGLVSGRALLRTPTMRLDFPPAG